MWMSAGSNPSGSSCDHRHLANVQIRTLGGPNYHFQDSLSFVALSIVLNDIGCVFGAQSVAALIILNDG